MISFSCLRLSSRLWIKKFSRFHSTKLTYIPKMQPQEFCFENYDCVGFDLDHTLCRYNLKPLFTLIYKTMASFLVEKYDYPKYLANITHDEMTFAQKGIILDKGRGNFLKLDAQYRILKASHGTRPMSEEDVRKVYGQNAIWEEARGIPHKLVQNTFLEEPFYVFKDYFVTPGALICAKIIDIIDQKHDRPVKDYQFWDHYLEGIFYMYARYNFQNNSGVFYPNLKKYPQLYFQPCSDSLKKWLGEIRKNKVTFLLTSSNHDSAEFIAEYCLGPDWRKYFDIIVTFARKPGFFWKDKPFLLVDNNSEGDTGIKPSELKRNAIYSQGNFKELLEACTILSKTKYPKVVYFGDSLIEDVYAAAEIASCDSVAIVEEMLAEGMENVSEVHTESDTLTSEYWGSFFSVQHGLDNVATPEGNATLWAHLLSQHSRMRIPSLESIARLSLGHKIPNLGGDPLTSGYFPALPKALAGCMDENVSIGRNFSAL